MVSAVYVKVHVDQSFAPPGPVAIAFWNGFKELQSSYTVQSVAALSVDIPDIVSSPTGTHLPVLGDMIFTPIIGCSRCSYVAVVHIVEKHYNNNLEKYNKETLWVQK